MLIFYSAGIAAVAAENYSASLVLVQTTLRTFRGDVVTVQEKLYSHDVIEKELAENLVGMQRRHTPMSDHILEVLKNELQPYVFAGETVEDTFEWFEYLRALIYWDQSKGGWAPMGRFGWRLRSSELLKAASDPDAPGSRVPNALAAGLFGGRY